MDKKVKNYIILFIIFIVGILITLYLCQCYKVYSDNQKETPVIRSYLKEMSMLEELNNFILENPSSIIYTCTSKNDRCRMFEKELKNVVEKDDLYDDLVYLNVKDEELDSFISNFNKKFNYKHELVNVPAFIFFRDGKVNNIYQDKKDHEIEIKKLRNLIDIERQIDY